MWWDFRDNIRKLAGLPRKPRHHRLKVKTLRIGATFEPSLWGQIKDAWAEGRKR